MERIMAVRPLNDNVDIALYSLVSALWKCIGFREKVIRRISFVKGLSGNEYKKSNRRF